MSLSPSTVHQTRSMVPVAFLGMRMHQSGPSRRATTPARRASGRRAPAKTRFSDRSSVFDATTPPLPSVVAAAASTSSSSSEAADRPANNNKPVSIRLPIGPGDQADQAAAACVAAWREAKDKNSPCRLLVTLSLPLVGATDLDDWPGGIRQQFKAAKPMVERMLSEIRKQADGGGFFREAPRSSLWDDADAVCAYDSPKLACVVFPTPETLGKLDALARAKDEVKGGGGLTIIVNPQWSLARGSQLISDFGIGPWRRANEARAASFQRAFCLRSYRIRGDEARVWYSRAAELDFRAGREARESESGSENADESAAAAAAAAGGGEASPLKPSGPWNVFLVTAAGSMSSSSRLISSGDSEPSYSELETLLKERGAVATKGWLERAQSEAKFLKDSL